MDREDVLAVIQFILDGYGVSTSLTCAEEILNYLDEIEYDGRVEKIVKNTPVHYRYADPDASWNLPK